jgi:hypothetical protein
MVPVPTFEKLRFRFQLHIYTIKSKFFLKNLFPFYIVRCFTRKKIISLNKFIVKCEINYGSGSDFLTSYGSGSGSTRQKVTVLRFAKSYGSCGSGSGSTTLSIVLYGTLSSALSVSDSDSLSLSRDRDLKRK